MRLWKVVVLVNLALGIGLGAGYLWWAREVRELRQELATTRRVGLQRQAGGRSWIVKGIIRSVIPQARAVVITHETIPGLMQAMTMGFPVDDPKLLDGLTAGDPIRFTLKEKDERVLLVAIEKEGRP